MPSRFFFSGMGVGIAPKESYWNIMFLCCIARPIFNDDDNVNFYGLVKAVSVVKEYITQRTVNSRRRGEMLTRNYHINSETYRNLFVHGGVFDAAEEKMP